MIYVCLDCNKTQDYVFASRRLRGIRNGSRAIEQADQEAGKLLQPGECIRALGGVILAKFQDQPKASEFIQKARAAYHRYGIGIEAVCEKCDHVGDFYDILQKLLRAIRCKKDSPEGYVTGPRSTILAATCDTSGRGAAEGAVRLEKKLQFVTSSERAKWNMDEEDPRAKELLQEWEVPGLLEIPKTAEGVVGWSVGEDLVDKDVPGTSEERLLGMVFADVNGMGSLLRYLACDESKFTAFAIELQDCLRDSLKEALKEVLEKPVGNRYGQKHVSQVAVPFRLLFLGGDDLCYAVVGAYALPLTQKFIEIFEKKSSAILEPLRAVKGANLPPCLTISAGVVIAPYKYPTLSFRRLGRGLEQRAKIQGRAWARIHDVSYPPSLVDFHLVKNDVAGTLEDVRRFARTQIDGSTYELFGDPYLVKADLSKSSHPAQNRFLSLEKLLGAAGRSAAIPTSKLKALSLLLARDGTSQRYKEWWDHLDDTKKTGQKTEWEAICEMLDLPCDTGSLPVRDVPHLNTSALDALELMPLVALQKRWEG